MARTQTADEEGTLLEIDESEEIEEFCEFGPPDDSVSLNEAIEMILAAGHEGLVKRLIDTLVMSEHLKPSLGVNFQVPRYRQPFVVHTMIVLKRADVYAMIHKWVYGVGCEDVGPRKKQRL